MEDADRYRCRHIYLKQSNDPALQAEAACAALAHVEGILLAAPHSENCLHIVYSLDELTFEIVIDLLGELEFELDNNFLRSLTNTIYSFLEDNARDHMPNEAGDSHASTDEHPEIPHPDNDQYWKDYH